MATLVSMPTYFGESSGPIIVGGGTPSGRSGGNPPTSANVGFRGR
jgi:hypothetical protein